MPVACPCCGSDIPDDGRILVDDSGIVIANNKIARLTEKETEIFMVLHDRQPRMVTKEALFESLYWLLSEGDQPAEKIVDVWICKLRAKLKPIGIEIATIWGRGYRLQAGKAAP